MKRILRHSQGTMAVQKGGERQGVANDSDALKIA